MTHARVRRDPLAFALRAVAGMELLAALAPGFDGERQPAGGGAVTGEHLASSAALFLAATRPSLRVGALMSATLSHLARAGRLVGRRRANRLRAELTVSALLAGLLHEESRARRWEA
jgi:hypothetical protein